jgi:hypothetical protein
MEAKGLFFVIPQCLSLALPASTNFDLTEPADPVAGTGAH